MIEVREDPLAGAGTEALVRPIRTDWAAITTASRQVEVSAGEEWRERCAAQGELPLGSAAITDGGDLDAEFVIHAAVASPEEGASRRSVRRGLENGLRRADEWDVGEVAMPLLGAGPGALDVEASCRIMAPLLDRWVGAGADRRVVVCVVGPASLREALARWTRSPSSSGEDG